MIVAIADAIKRLDKEIGKMEPKQKHQKMTMIMQGRQRTKKCKYFDRGYCKYKKSADFSIQSQECGKRECCKRHPNLCKWEGSK